eukprot:7376614-Prymnesium_polylepis.1
MLDPIDEAATMAELGAVGFALKSIPRDGNCYPRACLASAGQLHDNATLLNLRTRAVDKVTSPRAIDGIPSAEIRRQEGLKITPVAALKQLEVWKGDGKWRTDEGDESLATAFQFGVSSLVKPTAVLEKGEPGRLLNPCKVYAMRDEKGLLRRQEAGPKRAETIPFWWELPYDQLLSRLRADPLAFSILLYDRTSYHYDALVRAPPIPPTELVDQADM